MLIDTIFTLLKTNKIVNITFTKEPKQITIVASCIDDPDSWSRVFKSDTLVVCEEIILASRCDFVTSRVVESRVVEMLGELGATDAT